MSTSKTTPHPSVDALKRVKSSTSTVSRNSFEKATKTASNASKQGEFGFPTGHLGYLTQEQELALEDFKVVIEKEGLYTPSKGDKPPSHSDALLLRYLRARRFVPKDALVQFKDTEEWRKTNELDNLYLNIDIEQFDESRRHYPQWLGRRDKRGIPVYLFQVGALDSKTMSAYTKSSTEILMTKPEGAAADKKSKDKAAKDKTPPRLLRLFALYENLAGFMTQTCTGLTDRPNPEVPITQSNNIVDISNVGLKQFWNLRGHMQDASVLATAHYPETLDRIFIVGAPSFFPTVWSWIKRWFDPITVSKIFILSEAQAFPTLSKFIDPENIPKQYGGKLEFSFGDFATVDPRYGDRLTWKDDGASGVKTAKGELRRWPKGPVKWVVREDGDWDLLAVGSVDGKARRDIVATLKVGENLGGWADRSLPSSRKYHPEASETEPAPASDANASNEPAPVVAPQAEAVKPAATNGEAVAPVAAAAAGTTLVPIAVPGTASASEHEVPSFTAAAGEPAILPPTQSANETIPPVPLAAVAEPLPTEDSKTS